MARRPMIVGNWKMNAPQDPRAFIELVADSLRAGRPDATAVLICPPATLIAGLLGRGVRLGGQNCHEKSHGAHTGDVSADMLADAGATHVILGHSERRAAYGESNKRVAAKARAAWKATLCAVICVGESAEARAAGKAIETVMAQIRESVPPGMTGVNCVLAYEPIWAIGTGNAATPADIEEMHAAMRAEVRTTFGEDQAENTRILYGGSVSPDNAPEILNLENVDGALVGGASLNARDFIQIANSHG